MSEFMEDLCNISLRYIIALDGANRFFHGLKGTPSPCRPPLQLDDGKCHWLHSKDEVHHWRDKGCAAKKPKHHQRAWDRHDKHIAKVFDIRI